MNVFEPIDVLEDKEEQLRKKVNDLPEVVRKDFFRKQSAQIKDPDTYAALNWLCVGGFHHLYLGRNLLFAVEFVSLVIAVLLIILGYDRVGIGMLIIMVCIELPQLFMSQKIARQRNYEISSEIFNAVVTQNKSSVPHQI